MFAVAMFCATLMFMLAIFVDDMLPRNDTHDVSRERIFMEKNSTDGKHI